MGSYQREPLDRGRLLSVARSAQLLNAFSEQQVEIGISDFAKRLGVAKSTVHRLAATLIEEGMLEQNPDTGKYRLGATLFRLGAQVRRITSVSAKAQPLLCDLRAKLNETVYLAVLDGTYAMCVSSVESMQAVRMRSEIGARKPAHCTAGGRAILAFQRANVVQKVLSGGLVARTPQTNTDPVALLKALEVVRSQGCAIEDEESDPGLRCIAAPVRNGAGEVVASVALGGPVSRLSMEAMTGFIPHLVDTAGAISIRLGHRPVRTPQPQYA